jgi:hypothetical protein
MWPEVGYEHSLASGRRLRRSMECPNEGGDSASITAGEEGQQLDIQPHCEVHRNQTVHKGQERHGLERIVGAVRWGPRPARWQTWSRRRKGWVTRGVQMRALAQRRARAQGQARVRVACKAGALGLGRPTRDGGMERLFEAERVPAVWLGWPVLARDRTCKRTCVRVQG